MKKPLIIGIIILVGFVLLSNVMVKGLLEQAVQTMTGASLRIERLNVSWVKGSIEIENLKLYNPAGFSEGPLADFPYILLQCDVPAVLKGDYHFPVVQIHLAQLAVERNESGQLNLNVLVDARRDADTETPQSTASVDAPDRPQPKKPAQLSIDLLDLQVGDVVYTDYTQFPPTKRYFNVNLHQRYSNIQDPQALVRLILVKAIAKTALRRFVDLDWESMQSGLSQILQSAQETSSGIGEAASEIIKGATDLLGDTFDLK